MVINGPAIGHTISREGAAGRESALEDGDIADVATEGAKK